MWVTDTNYDFLFPVLAITPAGRALSNQYERLESAARGKVPRGLVNARIKLSLSLHLILSLPLSLI